MPGVNEYISWTDDPAKKKLLHDQHAEATESNTIHCPCGQIRAMVKAYRCLYCGVYFCAPCAEVHFGQTIQAWRAEKKQKEAYTTIELSKTVMTVGDLLRRAMRDSGVSEKDIQEIFDQAMITFPNTQNDALDLKVKPGDEKMVTEMLLKLREGSTEEAEAGDNEYKQSLPKN